MKESPKLWSFLGFAVTSLGGTLLHYWYEWSGQNPLVAAVSGFNESTWEHMKLLFFPMFFFALLQRRFFTDCENFWCVKLKSIALGLILIPVIFYTYNGVFGKSPDFINISIFFISAGIAYLAESRWLDCSKSGKRGCLVALFIIALLFIVFTYYPLQIPLFLDPLTKTFGM